MPLLRRALFFFSVKGGGGKGMRVVMKAADFDESLELARVRKDGARDQRLFFFALPSHNLHPLLFFFGTPTERGAKALWRRHVSD
jgi:hypothetical protein